MIQMSNIMGYFTPSKCLKIKKKLQLNNIFYLKSVELRDGSKSSQEGVLKEVHANQYGESINGQYSFIGDDGQEYQVSYTADENGFRPVGAHLPTPPPTPESVLKALQYIKDHPSKSTEQYN